MPKFKVTIESVARIATDVIVEAEDYIDAEDLAIKDFEPIGVDWRFSELPTYNDECYPQEVEEVTDA